MPIEHALPWPIVACGQRPIARPALRGTNRPSTLVGSAPEPLSDAYVELENQYRRFRVRLDRRGNVHYFRFDDHAERPVRPDHLFGAYEGILYTLADFDSLVRSFLTHGHRRVA